MRHSILATGFAVASGVAVASSAYAASDTVKLSQADCQTVWKQASQGQASLSQKQAQPYVTDFKSVDANGDGMLSSAEWMNGCNAGAVKTGAGTGAASGTSGSSSNSTAPEMPKKY